ncbi:hypothetical protein JZ751_006151 [Albula glossodonta]|uniref:cysteine--tRNA ligase n=1 Tax=Albula glossodonta TaxID=121402 RepID=A0A8T2N6I6_9TELE|nr:hypothetical protein JZ751_006151 [Albula glossodonta]
MHMRKMSRFLNVAGRILKLNNAWFPQWKLCVARFGRCTALNTLFTRHICSREERKWERPTGHDTGLKTYNSLTKRKEPLILAKERTATWYSCGPTVYDHAHLGHACSYVRFDIVQRILSRVFGINVIHVMVITDIDDKIIKRALEENISPTVLARMYEEEFKNDMISLRVLPPAVYMRVTENIPHIIKFIQGIIRNGHAYSTSQGDVYFDIKSIGNKYGKLMGMGDTIGEPGDSDKRDPRDFALWKGAKPQEPNWESPWGPGRPGWHIECSTIASSVFGNQLDIHSGGIDLAFPHHENEIAQCEAYHQCGQWGNYFLHSGIEYSHASMNEARSSLASISAFAHNAEALTATQSSIEAALADDFDTPRAIDAIMSLVHQGNRQLQAVTKVGQTQDSSGTLENVVEQLVRFRSEVRAFALSPEDPTPTGGTPIRPQPRPDRQPLLKACDAIRKDLAPLGVHDRGTNSTWEISRQRAGPEKEDSGEKEP